MDEQYDPNEAMPDVDEPEHLPTAPALQRLCDLIEVSEQWGFYPSDTCNGFAFVPWENDIAINFEGSEFILSLRPSNRIV